MTFAPEDRILILLSADKHHDISMWNPMDESIPYHYREITKTRIVLNAVLLHKLYRQELDILEKQFSAFKWYNDFRKHICFPASEAVHNDIKRCIEKGMIYQKNSAREIKRGRSERYELTHKGEKQLQKIREIAGDYFIRMEKRIQKWGTIKLGHFYSSSYGVLPEYQLEEKKEPEYGFPEKKRLFPKMF